MAAAVPEPNIWGDIRMRSLCIVLAVFAMATGAYAGTYYFPSSLPDQVLVYDTFPGPPTGVLAPAGVYKDPLGNMIPELVGGNLVVNNPDGGIRGEYSTVSIFAAPPGNVFSSAVLSVQVSGATVADVRDGNLPGLAVGAAIRDSNFNNTLFVALNRTTAGADYFDQSVSGGVPNIELLTPGTGYITVIQTGFESGVGTTAEILGAIPIPEGALADTEFRVSFDEYGVANFYWHNTPIVNGYTLPGQPDGAGTIVMQLGTINGNPAFSDVTFGIVRADGDEVVDGGDPPTPMPLRFSLVLLGAVALAWFGHRRARLVDAP